MADGAGPCLRDGDQKEATVTVDTTVFAFTSRKLASLHPDRSERRASESELKGFVSFRGRSLPRCPSAVKIGASGSSQPVLSFLLISLANLDAMQTFAAEDRRLKSGLFQMMKMKPNYLQRLSSQ